MNAAESTTNRIRLTSPAAVEQMARVNRAPFTRTVGSASVQLADVVYFWTA